MIVKVYYKDGSSPENTEDMPVVAKLIDCEEIIIHENSARWGFSAYKDNKKLGHYEFGVGQKVVAYIMVDGKTVDKLPRR